MATKATHSGHCQVCGASQKLPGGRLAKHGYTTRWGFFEGVCHGSHNLPFEVSKDLIEHAIAAAERNRDDLRAESAAVRFSLDVVWVHEYVSARSRHEHSGYIWRKLAVSAVEVKYGDLAWVHKSGRSDQGGCYADCDDLAAAGGDRLIASILITNGRRADHLEKKAGEVQGYIDWQRERVVNWAPAALTPVA